MLRQNGIVEVAEVRFSLVIILYRPRGILLDPTLFELPRAGLHSNAIGVAKDLTGLPCAKGRKPVRPNDEVVILNLSKASLSKA